MNHHVSIRQPAHFEHIDDEDLARLTLLWRLQALRGNSKAQKIALRFELEQRKRFQLMLLEKHFFNVMS